MLLAQTLAGIRSALAPQGAQLIGGHTLESRDGAAPPPLSQAMQVILTVSGQPRNALWPAGLQAGTACCSAAPGTGVLFAAAAARARCPPTALDQMATSQHPLVEALQARDSQRPGLSTPPPTSPALTAGHLGEMQRNRRCAWCSTAWPSPFKPSLLESGQASTLAPANRRAWANWMTAASI